MASEQGASKRLSHRRAWKGYSPKSTSSILHIQHPLLWVEDSLFTRPVAYYKAQHMEAVNKDSLR
jgi:hypothetical protein